MGEYRATDPPEDTLPASQRYACPCCAHLTLAEKPPDTFAICPVCYWEDDGLQFAAADTSDGANSVSLNQARANFLRFGASCREAVRDVRAPLPHEIPPPKVKPQSESKQSDDEGDTP